MKWVCGFAICHIVTHYYATSHRVAWSIALSVCHTSDQWVLKKTCEAIKLPFALGTRVGPMNHVLHDVYRPTSEGAILSGKQADHCKVYGHTAVVCANTAEPIDLAFWLWTRVGRRMHSFNRVCQVAPVCPHGRIRCRHLSNNIGPSIYGGDAPYVKLLRPHVIFGHAHLDIGTDSQALRAEYCIVGIPRNTAI